MAEKKTPKTTKKASEPKKETKAKTAKSKESGYRLSKKDVPKIEATRKGDSVFQPTKEGFKDLPDVNSIFQSLPASEAISPLDLKQQDAALELPEVKMKRKGRKPKEVRRLDEAEKVEGLRKSTAEVGKLNNLITKLATELDLIEPEAATIKSESLQDKPIEISVKQESPPVQAAAPEAGPTQAPTYEKGSRVTKMVRQARQFLTGSKVASPIEEAIRKELIPFTSKAAITKKFIEQNLAALSDVAKTNQSVAEILKHIEDPKYQKSMDMIVSKLTKNEEIFPEEMKEMISYFENVAGGLENVGVELSYSLPNLIKNVQEVIGNNKLDLKTKREALNTLLKVLNEQKIQNSSIDALEKLSSDQLNFSEEQVNQITTLSTGLLSDKEVQDKKLFGTFSDLNKKVGAVLLNIKEWKEFAEKPSDTDDTVKESLLSKGLGAVGTGVKQGLLDTAFAAIGLPGLGTLLGGLGVDPLKGVGSIFKGLGGLFKGGSKVGGLAEGGEAFAAEGSTLLKTFGALGRGLSPIIELFSELIIPLVTLGSALYGAVNGIMNTLDEWKKFGSGILDFGKSLFNYFERLYHYVDALIENFAKANPVLGGLIHGLEAIVSTIIHLPEIIIKKVVEGFENIFGWLGIGAGKAGSVFSDWSKKLDSFLPEKKTTEAGAKAEQQVAATETTALPMSPEVASTPNVLSTLTGSDRLNAANASQLNPQSANFLTPPIGKTTATPVELNTQSSALATNQYVEDRQAQQRSAERSSQPIVVQVPPATPPPQPSVRKNQVDDFGVAIANLGLLYR